MSGIQEAPPLIDGATQVVDSFFEPDSRTPAQPTCLVVTGAVATGKTTLRERDYATGYVIVDAAELFHRLTAGGPTQPFPPEDFVAFDALGRDLAARAVRERRSIATELLVLDDELVTSLHRAGYRVRVVQTTCSVEEALRRNETRGDRISSYYAAPLHKTWLVAACGTR